MNEEVKIKFYYTTKKNMNEFEEDCGANKFKNNDTNYCLICGDKANAHCHYGAVSCTSCRAFFRRSVTTDAKFQCIFGTDKCKITKITRKRCQACRLKKCLRIGMNPGWIKGKRASSSSSSSSPMREDNNDEPTMKRNCYESSIGDEVTEELLNQGNNFFKSNEEDNPVVNDNLDNNNYHEKILNYGHLLSNAIRFANEFKDFELLSPEDKRILLLNNADPIIQLITKGGGMIPPWCENDPLYTCQYRELFNEIRMLRPDTKTLTLVAFMALFSTKFSMELQNVNVIKYARDYGQKALVQYLTQVHGSANGIELFSKWARILHCLQGQAQISMVEGLKN